MGNGAGTCGGRGWGSPGFWRSLWVRGSGGPRAGAELAAGAVLTRLAVLRLLTPAAPLGTLPRAAGTCASESHERAMPGGAGNPLGTTHPVPVPHWGPGAHSCGCGCCPPGSRRGAHCAGGRCRTRGWSPGSRAGGSSRCAPLPSGFLHGDRCVGGVSMGTGGVLQPHEDSQPWAGTWSSMGTPSPGWGPATPRGHPAAGRDLEPAALCTHPRSSHPQPRAPRTGSDPPSLGRGP